ncbi:MAG: hypothetical protein NVS2B3_18190 [Vulcanimicrobiaceae bacterium]
MPLSLAPPRRNHGTTILALVALFALLLTGAPRPARADSASTTAVLLGAAAAAAAIIISNNVRHKAAQANTPVGRTQDGGTILGDGRVVYPNGDVLYTGNENGRCTYDGYGNRCDDRTAVYYPDGYYGHDHGHHYGQYKHHGHDGEHEHGRGGHQGDEDDD